MTASGNARPAAASGDPATVMAAGILAATAAAICHESIGHGVGCLAGGGRIALLTSIWFQCSVGLSLADAGGPLVSLCAGAAALAALHRSMPPVARLVLLLFASFSLFWFAAQLIDHALLDRDDWAFIARRSGWPRAWRPVAVVIGIVVYAASFRAIVRFLRTAMAPTGHAVSLGYAAAVASAVVAGLAWPSAPLRGALEAALTLGGAPLGLLVAAWRAGTRTASAPPIPRSWGWIAASILVFGLFVAVQGRGLGPDAGAPLPSLVPQ